MPTQRRAVIDVGTNSIKLLVADVGGDGVQPVLEDSEQTRLGAGFYKTHRLQPQAVANTARAVALFVVQARQLNAVATRIIGTSAARDAVNVAELTAAIEQACGLKLEIISGEQEADWAFRGVTQLPELAQSPLLLLDVGGGSTEFILGQGEHRHFCKSFPLGVLRVLETMPPNDPPAAGEMERTRQFVRDFLEREVRPRLQPALNREVQLDVGHRSVQLVGTGGTATILARIQGRLVRFQRERIEGMRLSLEQVRGHARELWGLSLADRKRTIGLPKKRADVILPGVLIYEVMMETFGFSEVRVSTRGLRFAAVKEQPPA